MIKGYKFFAIYGDSGANDCTEGSIKLQQMLGHPEIKDARHTIYGKFKFTIFKESGCKQGKVMNITPDEIQTMGQQLSNQYLNK